MKRRRAIEQAAQHDLRLRSPLLPTLAVRWHLFERVGARKPLRCQPSGIGTIAAPISKLLERERECATGGIGPRESLLRLESLEIAQPTILVALQPHAAPSRHLWDLIERENHHLAVLADRGDELALNHRERAASGGVTLSTCLPLRVLARHSSSATTKPRPCALARRNLRPPWWRKTATTSASCSRSMKRRIGSPCPRPPGSLAASRV